jgi:peptidoglycan hydrolase-like protein with peptidoglycan-binding domain
MKSIITVLILIFLISCSAIKTGGSVTKDIGKAVDEAGNKEGRKGTFIGKSLNFVGGIYTKIGGAMENMAEKGEDPNQSKGELFIDTNKEVISGVAEEAQRFANKSTVYDVQKKLKEKGYDPGSIDGIYGKKTEKAICKFQKDNGINPTGEIDEVTLKALGI